MKYDKIKIKIFIILIFLYNIKILEISFAKIKEINNHIWEKYNLRFLLTKNNYDSSQRTQSDIDSIENCEKTDYQYFVQYITGHNVTFDKKKVDRKRAVSNIQYIIIYLFFLLF